MFEKLYNDIVIAATCMVFILIAGCGENFEPEQPDPGIHADLIEYVERFEDIAKEYHGDDYVLPEMDIDIGDTSNVANTSGCFSCVTVGWCVRHSDKPSQISYSDAEKELLMFHELGHCVLDRRHRDTLTPHDVPLSIMATIMIDVEVYKNNREYYIDELFTYKDESVLKNILRPDDKEHSCEDH